MKYIQEDANTDEPLEFFSTEESYKDEYLQDFKHEYETFEDFVADRYGMTERDEEMGSFGFWDNP